MKKLLYCSCLLFIAAACQKKDAEVKPLEAEDADWIKLEVPSPIPTDDLAYAIAGDLDKTLLVSTKFMVYATSDRGKTWQISKNSQGPVPLLLERNDTILAFRHASNIESFGEGMARDIHSFTTDYGKTWFDTSRLPAQQYIRYRDTQHPAGRVQVNGAAFSVKGNTKAGPNVTSSRVVVASDLLRTDGSGQATDVRLPARHFLQGLHLDAQNRLYVGASGQRFDEVTGDYINPTVGGPAVVYVSRKPVL